MPAAHHKSKLTARPARRVSRARVEENPSKALKRLKRLAGRGSDAWIVYDSYATEAAAYKGAGALESAGVRHVKVTKSGGGLFGSKERVTYEVRVLREGIRAMGRREAEAKKTPSERGVIFKGEKITGGKGEYSAMGENFPSLDDAKIYITMKRKNPSTFTCIIGARKSQHDTAIEAYRHGLKEQNKGVHSVFRVKHPSGEVDEYGRDGKKRNPSKRKNPASGAVKMREAFTGLPSNKTVVVEDTVHVHSHLAALGELIEMKVKTVKGETFEIGFTRKENPGKSIKTRTKEWLDRRAKAATGMGDSFYKTWINPLKKNNPSGPVLLACSEDGKNLFCVGGSQKISLSDLGLSDLSGKEMVVIGQLITITYHVRKKFDGKEEEFDYVHKLSEESGGPRPMVRYSNLDEALFIDGGVFYIPKPLLGGASPGITD